jgi:serine/threonine-protein kinase
MNNIGPYQIVEILHRGPQPLYRARSKDGKDVALKAVAVDGLSDEARERFTREAATCRALDHPNIVKVFDAGEADGHLYQAMEMLEGADLGKVMAEGRHFTWDGKLSMMEQVAEGLEYAHQKSLVHRDIKPANLFLENSGRVKVLDFGMVRVAESELTKVGASVGTLNYMAPEQIRGERCTAASDVFSAGIVFYQLASGRHPFSARDRGLAQVVSAIVFETPPKLSEICPDAPEGLEFILNRALDKDPARRIPNAGELRHALGLCRTTLGLGPPALPDADAEKTRVMKSPEPAAVDGEKTRVMQRTPVVDEEKTRAMQRPAVATAPPPPAPAPQAAPPVRAPVVKSGAAKLRYCPSCTTPNPADATVCQKCQTPLAAGSPARTPQQQQWALYLFIAVAVILAIVLVAVLLTK